MCIVFFDVLAICSWLTDDGDCRKRPPELHKIYYVSVSNLLKYMIYPLNSNTMQ